MLSQKETLTTLYKYRPVNENTISVLEKQRLYLDNGTNFNDPFEIMEMDAQTGEGLHIPGLHILCLCNSHMNKLMWSHYADSHKGICLSIQVPTELVYPLHYTSKRLFTNSDVDKILQQSQKKPRKNIDKPLNALSLSKKKALLKDRKWIYEREYRIVFDETDESDLIYEKGEWFFPVKIKNVYLGVNFEKNEGIDKQKIIEICKERGIKLTHMELSKSNYAIKVVKEE